VSRRLLAALGRFGGIAALIVVAAGCRLDVTTTLDVARNGSGKITVTAIADAELVERAPELAEGIAGDDLRNRGWTVNPPTSLPDGGVQIVVERSFATPAEASRLLEGLSGPGGPISRLTVSRSGASAASTFTVSGELRLDGGLAAFADSELVDLVGSVPFDDILATDNLVLGDVATFSLVTRLPGDVRSASGEVDGNLVRWNVPLDGTTVAVDATSRNFDIGALIARVVSLGALGALAVWLIAMGVLAVRIARRRRAIRRTSRT
jgi:hypothetical protein